MAKSEKKISIASLDKVLKEQAVDIATEQWFGNEVKIKHTLSFSEALAFVDDVVSSCFHTTGGYMPELQEFVVKSNILTRYANFNLPDNLEHRYSLLYNTDAVDVVIRHINQKQLDDILESISEKISYLCESNIAAIERQMNEVVSAFTELQKKTEAMFANITPDDFSVVFSNRFKRKDYVNTLKDMVETSYSTSRSFDANKYLYNQAANQAASVSKFMKSSLDAAVNTIIAAKNQSVVINGSGIHVGGDSKYQLRIVDSMIAMTDDNWATAKLAIGLFASDEVGTYFGVNAEVIGGKLIVGNNLVIENETDDGVMQFKVDSSGAWLNNSTFVLQKDNGGKILIDPMYGIAAGTGDLYSVDGTTVYPSFISLGRSRDNILFDDDGMPQNANFYLDIDDGSVYIRGKVSATSGKIGGFTIEDDYLYAGSGSNYIALNGSGTNANSAYAMWAGAAAPASAKFWVKKNGDMYAKSGTFQGVVSGASFKDKSGNSMMNSNYEFTAGYLNLNGLNVGNGNFTVDASGNVSVRGSITMAAGSSINWASVTESNVGNSSSYQRANTAYNLANTANSNAGDAYNLANTALQAAYDNALSDRDIFNMLTNGSTRFGIFSDSTSNRLYINANYIRSGTIDADIITLGSDWGGFKCALGSDGTGRYTYGAKMYGSNEEFYFIATNAGVRMQSDGESFVVTSTRIVASTNIDTSSDRRLKNNISSDLDRYIPFFMRLQPSVYRFNSGRSGRFHTGFIAQEVEDALRDSGLSTQDFAGLVKCSGLNDAHSKYTDEYSLRYAEFISLNTYMIQRLYRRIDELEQKLQAIEA